MQHRRLHHRRPTGIYLFKRSAPILPIRHLAIYVGVLEYGHYAVDLLSQWFTHQIYLDSSRAEVLKKENCPFINFQCSCKKSHGFLVICSMKVLQTDKKLFEEKK